MQVLFDPDQVDLMFFNNKGKQSVQFAKGRQDSAELNIAHLGDIGFSRDYTRLLLGNLIISTELHPSATELHSSMHKNFHGATPAAHVCCSTVPHRSRKRDREWKDIIRQGSSAGYGNRPLKWRWDPGGNTGSPGRGASAQIRPSPFRMDRFICASSQS